MDKDHFWTVVERSSYVATLFASLVEMLKFVAPHLF